jgi:outer membrane protein assembly factor BamB
MFEETLPPLALDDLGVLSNGAPPVFPELAALLLGRQASGRQELPPLADLVAGALALALGQRRKVILPLARMPAELALVRREHNIAVDYYGTEAAPEVLQRERIIALQSLLDACARACALQAGVDQSGVNGRALRRLEAKLKRTRVVAEERRASKPLRCTGGTLTSPGAQVPLSFGFEALIPQSNGDSIEQHAFADVHALLFEGELWAFSGERRVRLARGPIMLVAQRMLAAVRSLVDAWQGERAMNVRLRSGDFSVSVRREAQGAISWTTSTERNGSLTWPALDIATAALPVLRLISDLIRKLVAVDRAQSHNLRVTALRNEVRALRRTIRGHSRREGFENPNPERLRLSSPEPLPLVARPEPSPFRGGRLRYSERWSREVEALDANAIFTSGEHVIVATTKLTLALERSTGEVNWSLPSARATTLLLGRTLLRLLPEGGGELLDPEAGQVYARCDSSLRLHNSTLALFAGGGDLPPVAILSESGKHLVAIDLRTGAPRWRFRGRSHGQLRAQRAGRVLLVTGGDGCIDALDVASGEVVWRHTEPVRFCAAPVVWGDTVVAASGELGGSGGALHAVELFSGKALWRQELAQPPSGELISTQELVLVPTGGSRDARLYAFEPAAGSCRWHRHDPGLDNGGRGLEVEDTLIVNTPAGRCSAIALNSGETRWTRALANPLTDDVPRQLLPVLRHGALFVPSAQVHVLSPRDGSQLSTDNGCDLVPDFLRVDERAWFYVAEESGHLRAYAGMPQLTLVHSR